ncbi:MAG TPA: hypothetical protein VHZ55_25970 [Bryobacteraceae bacterium]|jgi:hypothetical protein|nr:hypothetical protein [Bryobacteraceae bacterium]
MRRYPLRKAVLATSLLALSVFSPARAQQLNQLVPRNVALKQVTYQGHSAIQVIAAADAANGSSYALVKDTSFRDGTIEVNLAGKPAAGAGPQARGFIGIAFRLRDNKYEYIYLRPTNGRADDQVRRNHSTQYSSYPQFDFARLRQESPEMYESYVDLQPGAWTKFRIEIDGRKARLYVHGAEQPTLIVNDLKMVPQEGAIALWVGPGTEGYFEGLKITPQRADALSSSNRASSGTIYFDMAHGEAPWPPQMAELEKRVDYKLEPGRGPITPQALAGSKLIYLRAPSKAFQHSEKQAIISFVNAGGSLLLVLDEEERQKLAVVGANDIIEPFGLKLSGDTPHVVNPGAIAKAGEINQADREIPYDGGRQVFGGTPFAYQLDRAGNPAQPSAAYVKLANGARVVVMGEGMASLFLGVPEAVRLTVDPANPKWWGKDSQIFMQEVLSWLLETPGNSTSAR